MKILVLSINSQVYNKRSYVSAILKYFEFYRIDPMIFFLPVKRKGISNIDKQRHLYYLSSFVFRKSWIVFYSYLPIQYRRPSLFAGLLFVVLIIRGFIYITQNLVSAGFPSIIRGFSNILAKTVLACYPRFWYPWDFLRM